MSFADAACQRVRNWIDIGGASVRLSQSTRNLRPHLGSRAPSMEFIVWVETRVAGKTLEVREVAKIERTWRGLEPEGSVSAPPIGFTTIDIIGSSILSY